MTKLQTLIVVLMSCIYTSCGGSGAETLGPQDPSEHVDVAAFERAVSWPSPTVDVVVNLLNRYDSLGLARRGHAFFEERARRAAGEPEEAWFLAAWGLFHIQDNQSVGLLRRTGFVREGVALLDDAVALQPGLTTYLRGVALVNLPQSFGETERGMEDLRWVLDNRKDFPGGVWRGALRHLALGHEVLGQTIEARQVLELSGHVGVEHEPRFATSFSVTPANGFRFATPRLQVLGDGLYQAEAFDFGDMGFVETPEGLVMIDVGTHPDNAAAALAAVRAHTAAPLHSIVLTHAHWDHIGGLKGVDDAQVVTQIRFEEELSSIRRTEPVPFGWFFGEQPVDLDVTPDVRIDADTPLGTSREIRLIPTHGGETHDALLVHVPDADAVWVGDAFMPYLGAPFTEEGDPEELLTTIDQILALQPRQLLHGHPPLTELFTVEALDGLHDALTVLVAETKASLSAGVPLHVSLRRNVLPDVLQAHPDAVMPFLVMRTGVIKRLYDLHTGYWQADREGVETLGPTDWARAVDLLANGERGTARAVEALLDAGEAALPLEIAELGLQRHPDSTRLRQLHQRALQRLRKLHSVSDPFRFIVYSETAGTPLQPLPDPHFETP